MRLLLQGKDSSVKSVPDQYLLFTADGLFTIATYVTLGYNACDAYIVGAGGGGGGGGGGRNVGPQSRGAGGGGGGGGGAIQIVRALQLLSLPGETTVKVGKGGAAGPAYDPGFAGGYSFFNGFFAYGGGGGGDGSSATTTNPGFGGSGGGGGGIDAVGDNGGTGSYNGTDGGAGIEGGTGGLGGGSNKYAGSGKNGKAQVAGSTSQPNDDLFGGGGGGGGGRGMNVNANAAFCKSGSGGNGRISDPYNGNGGLGEAPYAGPEHTIYDPGWYAAGGGGGGGGGADLTALTGFSHLDGKAASVFHLYPARAPGAGGMGGHGGLGFTDGASEPGQDGADGCVLLRIYKL